MANFDWLYLALFIYIIIYALAATRRKDQAPKQKSNNSNNPIHLQTLLSFSFKIRPQRGAIVKEERKEN